MLFRSTVCYHGTVLPVPQQTCSRILVVSSLYGHKQLAVVWGLGIHVESAILSCFNTSVLVVSGAIDLVRNQQDVQPRLTFVFHESLHLESVPSVLRNPLLYLHWSTRLQP